MLLKRGNVPRRARSRRGTARSPATHARKPFASRQRHARHRARRARADVADEDAADVLRPGSRIGTFDLIDVVGEGGSSTVFRAERTVDGIRQVVALKLLRRGLYTSDAKRQFRRERLALSQLEHPGTARFIEGGVTDAGVAYIALDFVDGMPITDFVREHRLDVRARLALFLEVCRAVEAAHRALIVHRDLKPTNVLVNVAGRVKLVDFGIAKLLDTDDGTRPGCLHSRQRMRRRSRNPALRSRPATDVYALGILLGEIMTGHRLNDDLGRTPSGPCRHRERAGRAAGIAVGHARSIARRSRQYRDEGPSRTSRSAAMPPLARSPTTSNACSTAGRSRRIHLRRGIARASSSRGIVAP